MCGVGGVWSERLSANGGAEAATSMAATMVRRGPDADGLWQNFHRGVTFCHRRLAVVDLSDAGRQPMHSVSGRYVVTFNGEIFNFKILRGELETAGCVFRSTSDTEVLLAAVETWGVPAAVRRFVGMFAFAIFDQQEDELWLVRDRLGKKPLYFFQQSAHLVFASQLTAFRGPEVGLQFSVCPDGLRSYLQYGYVLAPWTLLAGVRKVAPGQIVRIDRHALRSAVHYTEQYWSVCDCFDAASAGTRLTDDIQILGELDVLLQDAVACRRLADVPLGSFLSGGIDSSLVTAVMQSQMASPVKTFSIGFAETGFDESPFAKRIASLLGTEHTEVIFDFSLALSLVPDLPRIYDEPIADPSSLPTVLLASIARPHVTVVLSGDGGDEAFGGYQRYRWFESLESSRRGVGPGIARAGAALLRSAAALPFRGVWLSRQKERASRVASVLSAGGGVASYQQLVASGSANAIANARWRGPVPSLWGAQTEDTIELARSVDLSTYLPENLMTKVDRASMWSSLEVRAPLMDHRIVELAARIDPALLGADRPAKWPLRRLLERHIPAAEFDRPKMGFAIPLDQWLAGPLKEWVGDLLSPAQIARFALLDGGAVQNLLQAHAAGRFRSAYAIWNLVILQAWCTEWLNG